MGGGGGGEGTEGIGREEDLGRKKLMGYTRSRFIERLRAEVSKLNHWKNKIFMNLDRIIDLIETQIDFLKNGLAMT